MLQYPEEVELDLLDVGLDLKDWFRPAGDPRRLSTRRLLLVVDKKLDKYTSLFWSEVFDRDPVGLDQIITSDIYAALVGAVHPVRTRREDEQAQRELEEKKERIRRAEAFRQAQFREWGIEPASVTSGAE